MDWDNVRVFLAVARAGQFVAAAKRLRLDHATVSRRIASLEAALGAKLFDRRTTGAKLTSAFLSCRMTQPAPPEQRTQTPSNTNKARLSSKAGTARSLR